MVSLADLQVRSRIDYQTLFDRCTTSGRERKKIKWKALIVSRPGQDEVEKRGECTAGLTQGRCRLSVFIKQLSKIRNTQRSLKIYIFCSASIGAAAPCRKPVRSEQTLHLHAVFSNPCLRISVFSLFNAFCSFVVWAILTSHSQFCL